MGEVVDDDCRVVVDCPDFLQSVPDLDDCVCSQVSPEWSAYFGPWFLPGWLCQA